jgi:hypothetical protein
VGDAELKVQAAPGVGIHIRAHQSLARTATYSISLAIRPGIVRRHLGIDSIEFWCVHRLASWAREVLCREVMKWPSGNWDAVAMPRGLTLGLRPMGKLTSFGGELYSSIAICELL